jgi:hypothetical protein
VFSGHRLQQVGDRVDSDDSPADHEHDSFAQPFGLFDVVGGQKDRRSAAVKLGDQLSDVGYE